MAFLDETGGLSLTRKILGSSVLIFGSIDNTATSSTVQQVGISDTNFSYTNIKWNNTLKYFVYLKDSKYYDVFGDPNKISYSGTYQGTNSTPSPKKCLYYSISAKRLYYWNGSSFDQLTDSNTTYSAGIGLTLSGTTFSLNAATSSNVGGIKLGYTQNGKNYPVLLSNNQAYVSVPWTDNNTNTTYTFTNGTNGSFTVTPSGSTAQTVSIGKPTTAGTADKANELAHTLTLKMTNTAGTSSQYTWNGSEDGTANITLDLLDKNIRTEVNTLKNTVASALVYKGTVANEAAFNALIGSGKASVGNCYVVTATIIPTTNASCINNSTKYLEAGDMLICRTGYVSSSSTKQTFDVLQSNVNGVVTSNGGTANKLAKFTDGRVIGDAGTVGNSTTPMYLNNGVPTALSCTIAKSVPSNAVFTDTTYGNASTTASGLVKLGYPTSGKNYPLQLDADGKAYVYVPWANDNTTYTAGTGLSMSGNAFSLMTASSDEPGGFLVSGLSNSTASELKSLTTSTANRYYDVITTSDGYGVVNVPWYGPASNTKQSVAANVVTATTGRTYAVQLNNSNQLVVNVPWSNTTYSAIATSTIESWF